MMNNNPKKKKIFDCVEMKMKAQEKLLEEVKGMSAAEKYAYWKSKEQKFLAEHPKMKKHDQAA